MKPAIKQFKTKLSLKYVKFLLFFLLAFTVAITIAVYAGLIGEYKMDHDSNYLHVDYITPKIISEHAKRIYFNAKFLRIAKLADSTVDSKNIVDRPTRHSFIEVLKVLDEIDERNTCAAKTFMKHYFDEPGHEILTYNSSDWTQTPKFIETLVSNELKEFSKALNSIWIYLYRRFDSENYSDDVVSSHIPMKHPFIVPGGRFREMYYWDNYWTLKGLLICGMYKSAKMMLENFIDFIDQFGFIPNGSRVYYLNRSQPPYFSKMVCTFYQHVKDSNELRDSQKDEYISFVTEIAVEYMIKEYMFWMTRRVVHVSKDGNHYTLNIYSANNKKPRIESYHEDIDMVKHLVSKEAREKMFLDITAATESGYDFSSRWFENVNDMRTIQTTDIIPVDLNSLLYETEIIIAKFCDLKGDHDTSIKFRQHARERKNAINALLWSDEQLLWCDYNIKTGKLNDKYFYIINLSPLWSNITPPSNYRPEEILDRHRDKLLKYDSGIPVSFVNTSQQWDFPNVWAPNQHSMILMLLKYDYNFALRLAKGFFNTVYRGWKENGLIFEKYSATKPGERGKGGEYEVQFGFGWTNGVIFSLINIFKDDLVDHKLLSPEP